MGSRSNITLVGNPTQGENIGISSGATGVYVGKVDSTLQFKSICGAGTVSIITGTTTITISGTSGGGGSISDGKNGLSKSGTNIVLGGALTGDTTIILNGKIFNISGTTGTAMIVDGVSDIIALQSAGDAFIDVDGINDVINIASSGAVVFLSGTTLFLSGTTITLDSANIILYGAIMFGTIPNAGTCLNSVLVWDSGTGEVKIVPYVSGTTVNAPITGATNGLSVTDKQIKLGGFLTGDTLITAGGNDFAVCGINANLRILPSGAYLSGGTLELRYDGTKKITLDTLGFAIEGPSKFYSATEYDSDFSPFTALQIPDAQWVTGLTSAINVPVTGATNLGSGNGTIYTTTSNKKLQLKTLSGGTNITLTCNGNYIGINTPTVSVPITGACNGLSVVNKNVVLGGTLTGHTLIDANSKDFCVSCARNIMLASTVGGYNVTLSGYNTYICGTNTLSICGQQLSVCDCAITPRGFRYSGNYRANFLCDSLVDAAYVTGKTSVISVPVTGATNLGSGNGTIYTTTSNKNLQLKTLSGGTNVTLTCNGNYIAINVADTEAAFGWSNLAKGSTVAGCGTQASGATLCNNTYYGVSAGTHTTSGSNNVGIGFSALHSNTIGNTNIAIGTSALLNNTGGTNNIAIGCEALCTNCCGGNNVANGYKALNSNTIGSYNFAVGCTALNSNISGCHNIAFGGQSLFSNNTASFNIALGYQTLLFNTVGNCNIAIGRQALTTNCSGSDNIAFGSSALHDNTTGSNNFAAGNTALNCNTTGCNNIAIGISALLYNKTTSNNIALGCQALYCNTGGTNNIAIGTCALCCNCNGIDNIALGSCALRNNTIGNCNIAVGCTTLTLNTTGCDNIAIGWSVLANNTTSSGNIGLGQRALNSNSTGSNNIAIGHQTLFSNTVSNNIAIGFQALRPNTTGTDNIGMGYFALRCNCIGSCNIAIGTQALWGNKSNNNIALGFCALSNITGGTNNIAIGFQALSFGACCGSYNIANGNQALYNNTLGCYNIANGYQALYNNRTGNCNVGIGTCTLFANSGGTNNIAIGQYAGFHETGSNKLYVANCASCSLIYGEFDNKRLVISGTTEIVNPVVSGACNYLYLGDKDTDGSWRFAVSGASMIIQRRVTGAYVTKQTIT